MATPVLDDHTDGFVQLLHALQFDLISQIRRLREYKLNFADETIVVLERHLISQTLLSAAAFLLQLCVCLEALGRILVDLEVLRHLLPVKSLWRRALTTGTTFHF